MKAEMAWPTGDRPGAVTFAHSVAAPIARAILAVAAPVIGEADPASLAALHPSDNPVGRYRITSRTGAYFVRVSSRQGDARTEMAIMRWLDHAGVAVNLPLAAGLPLVWQGRTLRLDVRPLMIGRHFDGSAANLAAIAETVRHCHAALARFPEAETVRAAARRRHDGLIEAHQHVATMLAGHLAPAALGLEDAWVEENRAWLAGLVESFPAPPYDRPGAQCVHGELHQGNVMICDGRPVLHDFEESVHLFAPSAWDLAYLVQRMCLYDQPDGPLLRHRLSLVANAYGASLTGVPAAMREVAWTNFCVIVRGFLDSGIRTPTWEMDKFIRLHAQVATYEALALA